MVALASPRSHPVNSRKARTATNRLPPCRSGDTTRAWISGVSFGTGTDMPHRGQATLCNMVSDFTSLIGRKMPGIGLIEHEMGRCRYHHLRLRLAGEPEGASPPK